MTPTTTVDRCAHIERLLSDMTHELAALRAIATRTETRLCVIAEHLGAKHLIETKTPRVPPGTIL